MLTVQRIENPFRPGAGHMPPYLAGRTAEQDDIQRLFRQRVILENVVLTGLLGVGKTVLLESITPLAPAAGWLWVAPGLQVSQKRCLLNGSSLTSQC